MKRQLSLLLALFPIVGGLTVYLLAQPPATNYTVADLPAGWGIDASKVQGTLLSVITANAAGGTPAGSDPNTWIQPIGTFTRNGTTNGWVAHIEWVTTNTSDSLYLYHDAQKGMSTTWVLSGWIMPGVNYKTFDAYTWKGKSGTEKKERYTVVVVGYVPGDTIPILY